MHPCPSTQHLFACLHGHLPADDWEALEGHLSGCARCRQKIESMLDEPAVQSWRKTLHRQPAKVEMGTWHTSPEWPERVSTNPGAVQGEGGADSTGQASGPRSSSLEASTLRGFPYQKKNEGKPTEAKPVRRQVGRYAIERELGHGGMGVVYLGYDAALKRYAAVKMLLAAAHVRPERSQRFLHEAAAVAQLHHPNIVQVFEVGEEGGDPFLAMEFINGPTLHEHVKHQPQPPRQAATLLQTLAHAVHHAHQSGVIHRDLKPGNVLLAISGQPGAIRQTRDTDRLNADSFLLNAIPKIVDFGLAKQLTDTPASLTGSNDMLGTPEYMAPELAAGDKQSVCSATDVYALGAILYELLTGRPPFRAPTPMETLIQVRVNDPVPPRRLQPGLDRDLETICLKCLEKEPRRRYASAADLAADLQNYLTGSPILARRLSLPGRLLRWCRRNRTVAGLTAVLIVGAMVAGNLLWQQGRQRDVAQARADQRIRDALAEAQRFGELADTAKEAMLFRSRQRAAVERAAALAAVEEIGPELAAQIETFRAALDRDDADHRLLAALDDLRLKTHDSPTGPADRAAGFRQALLDYGLPCSAELPTALSMRLTQAQPRIRLELLGELDRWTGMLQPPERDWIHRTLALADHDSWRVAVRTARQAGDQDTLQRLAKAVAVDKQPVRSLLALSRNLQTTERLALLHRVREVHPDDFWINMELALASFGAKPRRLEDVLRFATVASTIRDNPPTQLILGMAFADQGRLDDAEAAYRRAIALQADYSGAYYNLANLLGKQSRYADAEILLRQGIACCPPTTYLFSSLGHVLRKLNRPGESEAAHRQALAMDEGHRFSLEQLIILCREQKRYDEAWTYVDRAVRLYPGEYWPWLYQGKVHGDLGRWPEAAAALKKAATLRPEDVHLQHEYERALAKAAGEK